MKHYTTIQRGFDHKVYCEDALAVWQPKPDLFIGLVSDGCSGGINSHFASALNCKIVGKSISTLPMHPNLSVQEIGQHITLSYFKELRKLQADLALSEAEMLSTLMLAVVHEQSLWLVALGDGVISIDEEIVAINQQNMPDYPAYHLQNSDEELDNYLHQQVFTATGFKRFSMATDGILSFTNPALPLQEQKEFVLHYLLSDNKLHNSSAMLSRKCNLLYSQYNLLPADDVAIISVIN